jgi:preprotein translocase subunit YajC
VPVLPVAFPLATAIVRAAFDPGDGPPSGVRPRSLEEEFDVINPAYAQAAGAAGGSDIFFQLVPFLLIFIIMYFLLIRPQQKRVREHREMIKNVRRGDTVVMSGGLVGKVTKVVDDAEVEIEIAENVRVRVVRGMIQDVRAKGEPVKADAAKG